jgi:TRAP-type C4-dicarboxylate transport system substrate-binding protein
MKITAKLIAILIALVMLFALAACGGGTSGGGNASQAPSGSASPSTAPSEAPFAEKPEVTLVLTNHDSDTSLPGQFCHAWADLVYQTSRGRIKVEVNNGGSLAGPTQSLDYVKDGIVDFAFGLPSFFPGQFTYSDGLSLPYLPYKSSAQASEVMWKIWETTDILQNDTGYEGTKVILIRANADAPLITASKRLDTAGDLKGMTIRASAKPMVQWLAELGATGQGCPITELFQNLQNGAFDGAITDWQAVNSNQLYEVAKYYADELVQFNSHYFLMNEAKYNSLSAENKAVIDACSGLAALDVMKGAWDTIKEEGTKKIAAAGGELYKLVPAEHQKLRDAADKATQTYINDNGEKAQQLYDKIVELCG